MCRWSFGLIIEGNGRRKMQSALKGQSFTHAESRPALKGRDFSHVKGWPDLKGHGFSRAEGWPKFAGFSPCGNSLYPTNGSSQWLKPYDNLIMTARLKACPFKSATQGSE